MTDALRSMVLALGVIACGDNLGPPGPVGPPAEEVGVGWEHACARRIDGTLWCWGHNYYGQLGDGTNQPGDGMPLAPIQVSGDDWASLSVGDVQTCAIKTDGSLWCWGYNASGELGDGTTTERWDPIEVGGTDWVTVSTGAAHTCATRADGTLWCWGDNCVGQLGDGTIETRTSPIQAFADAGRSWARVDVFAGHTCAIDGGGSLWCWGGARWGAEVCGIASYPTQIDGTWADVSLGWYAAHALDGDGRTWRLWGAPGPFGAPLEIATPTWLVMAAFKVDGSPCGTGMDGAWVCSIAGQEMRIGAGLDWSDQLSAGSHQACAVEQDGSVWCVDSVAADEPLGLPVLVIEADGDP